MRILGNPVIDQLPSYQIVFRGFACVKLVSAKIQPSQIVLAAMKNPHRWRFIEKNPKERYIRKNRNMN
jgi:hypothetical protein